MMSSTGQQKRTLIEAARHLWGLGGARAYYRGLTVRTKKYMTRDTLGIPSEHK
jgi:hypothetical protein